MELLFAQSKSRVLIVTLLGVALGIFVLAFTGLPTRWILSCSLGLLILFTSMVVKIPRYLFLTLFFLGLPFITMKNIGTPKPMHYGGPAGFYTTFYDLPLIILYLLWIKEIVISKTAKIRFSKLDVCMLGIIGMSFLSMFNAVDIRLSFYEIFRLIIMYLVFFYIANTITTKRDLTFIFVPLLIGLFCEGLLGIFQFWKGSIFGMELIGEAQEMMTFSTISRVGGTLGHPNGLARYIGFIIPLTIHLQFAPIKKRYKVFCALIFLTSITALIMTLSRSAWIAFIISIVIIFLLNLKTRIISLHRAVSIAALAIVFLAVIVIAFQGLIITRISTYDSGAAMSRIPLNKVAMNMIEAHPFIGIGINNYAIVMENYDNTPEGITEDFTSVVHNIYLFIASEIGIPGLFLFLLFLILLFIKVLFILRSKDNLIICLTIGITAGFVSFLIQLLVMPDGMVSNSFLFFWGLSGIIIAISNLHQRVIQNERY